MLHDLENDDGYVALKTGSRGQRRMETQRKNVKLLLYSRRLLIGPTELLTTNQQY